MSSLIGHEELEDLSGWVAGALPIYLNGQC